MFVLCGPPLEIFLAVLALPCPFTIFFFFSLLNVRVVIFGLFATLLHISS